MKASVKMLVISLIIAFAIIAVSAFASVEFEVNVTPYIVANGTVNQQLNFTINNTGSFNITKVDIIYNYGMNYINDSNFTTVPVSNFSSLPPSGLVTWTNNTSGLIDVSSSQNFSFNVSVALLNELGDHIIVVTLTDSNGSSNYTNATVLVVDYEELSPTWSGNQSSTPTNYSSLTPSVFNVSWNDTTILNTTLITITNATHTIIDNASMTNTGYGAYGGIVYNYSILLPPGTYNWTSYANDTCANWNQTDVWEFTISTGYNPVTLYLNATENSNKLYTYPEAVNATASSLGGTVFLYRNDSQIANGTSAQSENILLGNGTYVYTVNASGNANYTDNATGVTYYAFVNKGTPYTILEWNDSSPVDIGSILNFTSYASNTSLQTTLYSNFTGSILNISSLVSGTNTNITNTTNLGLGTYVVYANVTGIDNYTDNSTLESIVFTVTDGESPTWSVNQSIVPVNYSTTTTSDFNVTWEDNVGIGGVFITVTNTTHTVINNASMTNDTYGGSIYNYSVILPAGTFNWTVYANDSTGIWNQTEIWGFNISLTTNPLDIYINNGTEYQNQDIVSTYGTTINVTGLCSSGNCNLFRNDTNVSSQNNTEVELGVGVWEYFLNSSVSQNMSANSTVQYVTINHHSSGCDVNITNVTSKYTVNQSNLVYCLKEDIYINGSHAIEFSTDVQNTILDCYGYAIDGNDAANAYGVSIQNYSTANNTIKNCNISDFYRGVYLYNTSNISVINSTFISNSRGIALSNSSNNTISNNNISSSSSEGIIVNMGGNNSIFNNTVDSSGIGINVQYESNNNISSNNMNYNNIGLRLSSSGGNFIDDNSIFSNNSNSSRQLGLYVVSTQQSDFVNDIDETNTINTLPIYYADGSTRSCDNNTVFSNASSYGFMGFVECSNVTIENSSPLNSILFSGVTDSTINGINMTYTKWPITFFFGSNNTITNSTITYSDIAVYTESSSNNTMSNNTMNNIEYSAFQMFSGSNNTFVDNIIENSGYGVRGYENSNINVTNNTMNSMLFAIFFEGYCNSSIFVDNVFNSSDFGVFLFYENNNNTFVNNNLRYNNYSFYLYQSYYNNITGGSIDSSLFDYYFVYSNTSNNFTETNFTGSREIAFNDEDSWFNYRNSSSNELWIKTNVSVETNITRNLNVWNQTYISWNDTSSVYATARYNLTGLNASTYYSVYNNSNLEYSLQTDSEGNLPSFTISLYLDEREIRVEQATGGNTTPSYSGNVTNLTSSYTPTGYSNFSIAWNDSWGDSTTVYLENNFSGTLENSSMNGAYPNYYYNSSPLSAGSYRYRFVSKNPLNNSNATDTLYFTVSQADNPVTLYLNNGTEYQNTVIYSNYGTETNVTAICFVGQCNLYLNETNASSHNNTNIILPVGSLGYTVNTSGNQNYSSNSTAIGILISKASNPVTLYLNGTENQNVTYTYPESINVTADLSGGTVFLYRNDSQIANGTSAQSENILLGNGTYVYTVNASGNANYTDNATGVTYYAFVNKGTLNLSLNYSPASTVTFGSQSIANATENNIGDSDVNYTLYRDGSLVDNTTPYNETAILPIGTYNYTFNSSGGDNWTANASGISSILTIQEEETGGFVTTGGSSTTTTTTTTTSVDRDEGEANVSIETITSGDTVNVSIIETEDLPVRKISITSDENVSDVEIRINSIETAPSEITYEISGTVYNYLIIEKENITDSDITSAVIRFSVDRTWFENTSLNYTDVSLYRWSNDEWVELTTGYIGSDIDEYFYEATTPGFSIFMIGESGNTAVPPVICVESWNCTEWSECLDDLQTRTCTDSNNCETTEDKPIESQTCETIIAQTTPGGEDFPFFEVFLIAVLIMLLIVFVLLEVTGRINLELIKNIFSSIFKRKPKSEARLNEISYIVEEEDIKY